MNQLEIGKVESQTEEWKEDAVISSSSSFSTEIVAYRHCAGRKISLKRRVEKLGNQAVSVMKRKLWDSNEVSIDAAQVAVDQMEHVYVGIRGFLVASAHSALTLYSAVKAGACEMENQLVRDHIVLPAISGMECAASTTIQVLSSQTTVYHWLKQTPFLGETIIAPAALRAYQCIREAWIIAQYPIPSKHTVRTFVECVMSRTKWFLSQLSTEFYCRLQFLHYSLTRTIIHTQWSILGSGPYATLHTQHKQHVFDNLCERYFSLRNHEPIIRYEFMAQIRSKNKELFHDLFQSGMLLKRGAGRLDSDDWLSPHPEYRRIQEFSFQQHNDSETCNYNTNDTITIPWFYLPNQNGAQPPKDTPWVMFSQNDNKKLEERLTSIMKLTTQQTGSSITTPKNTTFQIPESSKGKVTFGPQDGSKNTASIKSKSQWYNADIENDVFVDQCRYAVSILPTCEESSSSSSQLSDVSKFTYSSKLIMRPNFWRFYGPGNDVRRGTWLLDTQRHGLQPYSAESSDILEDAYLFLKSMEFSQKSYTSFPVLTLQVRGPNDSHEIDNGDDNELQFVQFRSLEHIVAMNKTFGGGFEPFHRRVFRGTHSGSVGEKKRLQRKENEISVQSKTKEEKTTKLELDEFTSLEKKEQQNDADSGTTDHLILVVHGVGEMLRSMNFLGMTLPQLSSIVECCGFLRKNHQDILFQPSTHEIDTSSDTHQTSVRGCVEYIPIEWHEAFAIYSKRSCFSHEKSTTTLKDISLNSVPHLRHFANDTMLDMLYYMLPHHQMEIMNIVVNEMNFVVERYRRLTSFQGKISLVAHSLGSVIAWDILTNHYKKIVKYSPPNNISTTFGMDKHSVISNNQSTTAGSATKNHPGKTNPCLNFEVMNVFMIGSPIAVLLFIRDKNDCPTLNKMSVLPGCSRVFNIFHPHDPAAYRMEPLIDKSNSRIEPSIVPHWNGGYRVQYQTKLIWQYLMNQIVTTQENILGAIEDTIHKLDFSDKSKEDNQKLTMGNDYNLEKNDTKLIVCGSLNEGNRLDYMLQVSVLKRFSMLWLFSLCI